MLPDQSTPPSQPSSQPTPFPPPPATPTPQPTIFSSPLTPGTPNQPSDPPSNVYPIININHREKSNRFYAFPILGFLVKIIILLPVYIWLGLIGLIASSFSLINSFVVLFKGKYWEKAYHRNLAFIRLSVKTSYFLYGLTDKYPGFRFTITDFNVDIPYPEHPGKFYAIPLLGGLVRIILLIPYYIYQNVITNAARIGVFFSSLPVLFMGRYPESTFEIARDSARVEHAITAYLAGFSDKYPSFHISMNHKTIKILLIILGVIWAVGGNLDKLNLFPKTQTPINSPFQLKDKF